MSERDRQTDRQTDRQRNRERNRNRNVKGRTIKGLQKKQRQED